MENITINGREYTISIEYDDSIGAPWEEHDGHGFVSEWTTRDKRAGELILNSDGRSKRFYDFSATMKKAREENWGISHDLIHPLADKLGRALNPGDIIAEAVRLDFEYLRAWCNDEWQWNIVIVKAPDGEIASLGGIAGDDETYISEIAQELAAQLESEYQDRQTEEATI